VSKARLRDELMARRRSLPADAQRRAADAVRVSILAWPGLVGPVFAYASTRGELGTRRLLDELAAAGFEVLVPRITARGVMEAARVDGPLTTGPFGLPSPSGPVGRPAVALVPGVGFDRRGHRLGQGGGYYDRWLAEHPEVVTVGICHACQVVDDIPVDAHDRPVQHLLTDEGWIL
jgi:5-formyltetrahydrofolate cyclo-ligase